MATSSEISRVIRSKKEAQSSYDRLSRWYDWIAGSEAKFRRLGLQLLAAQGGETVLEIGSGTGRAWLALATKVGEGGCVVGLELSSGMLRQAQQHAQATKPIHALVQADGAAVPLRDGCCDAVFICFTLELFDTPEIPLVLAHIRRVLRPDGRFCIVALAKSEAKPVQWYEWAHRTWPVWVDCRPIYTVPTLQEAGFQVNTHWRQKMWGLPVDIVLANP